MATANAHAASLSLALVTLITLLGPSVDVSASTPSAATSPSLWSAVLPNVALPAPLQDAASPIETTPLATKFANSLTRGAVFPATAAAFCQSASLVCENDLKVSSYGNLDTAAPRAPSITTINDFQFDFFLESALEVGGLMHLAENLHDPIPSRAFLPSAVADALPPLTTANLPKLRNIFHIDDATPMATMMGTASYLCENPALPGESKSCPLTLTSMAQFVAASLGSQVQALATSGAPSEAPRQSSAVKVLSVRKRSLAEGEHIIICHTVMFPSALYYCHHVTGTKVVQADLGLQTESNDVIHAVGICHMDTSMWASEHPAFTALNIPRGAEACHWTVQNDVVWVSAGTQ